MKVSRRDFLKIGAGLAATGAVLPIIKSAADARVPAIAPEEQGEKFVATVCAMCPSGCGLQVRVVNGKAVKVAGNPLHPLNQGVCCPKGQASLEVLYSPERLAQPMKRKVGKDVAATDLAQWEAISWDDALKIVSEKLRALREQGQAHTVAVLHGELRGQMRPLWSRFLSAYGSPNMLSTDSLDGEAARLAMFFAQGINGYPIYDVDNARYVLCLGGSLLESSRHLQKYLSGYGFMHRGASNRAKLIVVDSRLNVTAAKADEWIPIRPGTTGALALGIAHVLIKSGLVAKSFVDNYTFGYEDFKDDQGRTHRGFKSLVLEEYPIDRVADITGVPSGTIAKLAGEFGNNHPALAVMPTGRGDLAGGNGMFTALAIHALNALVGSIDVPGGIQVQQTPNLAPLPALPTDPVAEKSRAMARLDGVGSDYPVAYSAFQNLADNLVQGKPYAANALFLLNANPVHEAPQGKRFIESFKKTALVVSFSPVLDESAAYADLILPSLTFFEMWGDDILEGTGYPGIALRQPVVAPVRDGRNPGDVVLQLAKQLGGKVSEALPWNDFLTVVKQRVAGMQISWDDLLGKGAWSALVYFNAQPGSKAWAKVVGRDRVNAPKDGRFDFFSRELFAALNPKSDVECLPHFTVPAETADANYPFVLISQETMTQPRGWSGVVPTLYEVYGLQTSARWETWAEIHPQAAEQLDIKQDDLVWIESPAGKIRVRAKIVEGIWQNAINVPGGQGHFSAAQWGRESSTAKMKHGANPYDLMASGSEKNSGVAAMLPTRVKIYKA
ncbi:MAG: molybdopterin-dependent oxidoreductase [Chloroflexi bacterium]|nr:molybdopterin-dependent oxidoreductase [Chloroflexota bacterium]